MGDLLRRRGMMVEASPSAEWDYEWDYSNGIPMTNDGWTLGSSGSGSCELRNNETNKGQLLASANNSYRSLWNPSFDMQRGVMEVKLYMTGWASGASTRITLSNGTNGIQICTPNGVLRLFDNTTPANCTSLGVNLVSRQLYTFRLTLDGNVGSVMLDGVTLASNVDITNIQYASRTAVWSQSANWYSTYIQNIKVKVNRIT